jgi:hypothetical protein
MPLLMKYLWKLLGKEMVPSKISEHLTTTKLNPVFCSWNFLNTNFIVSNSSKICVLLAFSSTIVFLQQQKFIVIVISHSVLA